MSNPTNPNDDAPSTPSPRSAISRLGFPDDGSLSDDDVSLSDGDGSSRDEAGLRPEASWYPDPAGSAQLRWWDGRAWTAHLHDAPAPQETGATAEPDAVVETGGTVQPDPTVETDAAGETAGTVHPDVTVPPGAAAEPVARAADFANDRTDSSPVAPRLPRRFLWLMILVPLIQVVALLIYDLNSLIARTLMNAFAGVSVDQRIDGLWPVLAVAFFALRVLLALADWRGLKRAQLVHPFHWAWSFFGVGVYVIGRCVIVFRRTGRGLTPIWVWLGVTLLAFCLIAVKVASALAVAAQIAMMYGR